MNLLRHPSSLVFLSGFIVYISIRHVFTERTKGHEKVVRQIDSLEKALMGFVFVGNLLVPVIYLFTPLFAFADYQLPWLATLCGGVIMTAALWLFWRSHSDLGANWSMTLELRKGHQLISHGIYRLVRHPMYASILLFGIAQVLLLPNWIAGTSALVTFAPLYFLRTPREEQMMRGSFGDAYVDYMRQTGRIFPRLK